MCRFRRAISRSGGTAFWPASSEVASYTGVMRLPGKRCSVVCIWIAVP